MKKITSAILALLLAASMTACGEKASDSAEETTAQTTTAETTAATEALTEEATQKETEAETEETTETTEPERKKSEKDILVDDIIKTFAESNNRSGKQYCYFDDDTLLYTGVVEGQYGSALVDTKNYTATRIADDNSKEWYSYCTGGNIYCIYLPYFKSIDTSGNTIAEFTGSDKQAVNIYFLDDGNVLLQVYDGYKEQSIWGIFSPKLELIKELPKLSVDAGHGETNEIEISDIYMVYGNKAYVNYLGVNKILDLNTMEMTDPDEGSSTNTLFSTRRYPFVGKYIREGSWIYDVETDTSYDRFYSNFFVTEKSFYYVEDYKLYRYISEEDSELIYDGSVAQSNFAAVSKDNFLVYDKMGTFLVDMATGEEHKIEIK
ncbi:MAG: hypothetical protein ACI4I1_10305 [Oscillospiraceae bacterium]